MTTLTREQQAGKLYADGATAVHEGGYKLHSIAMHLIMMVDGTHDHRGPLWPVRELGDGSVRRLDRFIDYLLLPARDGLGLPSLYFLKRTLEATQPVKDGEEALNLVRSELKKEHIDFDAQARDEGTRLHGEREPLPKSERGKVRDNITNLGRGTNAAYLAARLKRDFPEFSERLANGEFRSVRQAAIAAGIITPPTLFDQVEKLLVKMSDSDRRRVWRLLEQLYNPPAQKSDHTSQISMFS